jgi:UDP-GlcNAc:undecaprenyl-phosphate GlcNAc-1-phosphate transferase
MKLIGQVLAGIPLLCVGITVKCFVSGQIISWFITLFWILLITNAFNLLDNMNGLSAGLAVVICFNFFLVSYTGSAWFMMAAFALLGGAALGFLPWNFPKAKVFMGDSGALFLGYMIGALSVMVTYYDESVPSSLPIVSPIIILGIPLYDSLSVMWIRWRNGKPLMVGDKNHISHRLERMGFSRISAVLLVWTIAFAVGVTACNLRDLNLFGASIALTQIILWFFVIHWLSTKEKKHKLEK